MHDVDTAVLRTFLAVAESGSFSRAGMMVGRSQSAVSEQIRKLEELFGRRLLDRTTRRVRLTTDGEQFLSHARAMVAQADAMLARFHAPDLAGEVRFGSPEDFASAYLPDILGLFAAAHPAVELHVTCQLTLPLVEEFEAGGQDLIIVKQDPAQRYPGSRPLWREQLVWVSAPGLTADFGEAARGRLLPLVLSPSPCVYRGRATRALDKAGATWSGVFTSPSFAGQAAAVRAGLGYAVMPRAMVPPELAILTGWPDLAEVEIALLGQARLTPAAAALAGFVAERVARRQMQV
ncbi:LysR family transcriptional regulator [Tabrizicola sp. TH137]|uniref:LysR family transcriptional regulator n=1 Tax=Tabrizicola sp. TH137 TaxID=2067452 RepID=UPI000C7AD1CE|nr:LysR family transcriptional regulator [Tabrizicola sp. TH137]PLL10640.1 LysR family transcriptional regulator [Tabrizicola sp. TH137]